MGGVKEAHVVGLVGQLGGDGGGVVMGRPDQDHQPRAGECPGDLTLDTDLGPGCSLNDDPHSRRLPHGDSLRESACLLAGDSAHVCKCKHLGNTGDMGIDVSGLGDFIRDQRDQAQMSLRQLAKAADVSNPYLSQVERGLRKPSAEILGRIAQGLRISAETLYVQAGILAQRAGDDTVTTAIAADRTITERQRTTLLQIYAAFQAENQATATSHASEASDDESSNSDSTTEVNHGSE